MTQYKLARPFDTQPGDDLRHEMTQLRRLSEIQRWAVVPVLRRQSVAEHSFHVACICRLVARHHAYLHDGSYDKELLIYALDHDTFESVSGDKPSPYKRWLKAMNPGVILEPGGGVPTLSRSATKAIQQVVKISDFIEALLFLEEEVALGNKRLFAVRADVWVNYVKAWQDFEWKGPPNTAPPDSIDVVHKPSAENYFHWWQQMLPPDYHPGLEFDR